MDGTRLLTVSFVLGVFIGLSGIRLLSYDKKSSGIIRQITGTGFWILTVINILRIIFTLAPGASIPSFLENSPVQTLLFSGSFIAVLVITIGYLLMCNERFNQSIRHLAATDGLTGLYNRREIENLTRLEMARAQRTHQPLTYLLLDGG